MCENNFWVVLFVLKIINCLTTCCCAADDVGVVFPKLPELFNTVWPVEFVFEFGLVLRVEFWAGELPVPETIQINKLVNDFLNLNDVKCARC